MKLIIKGFIGLAGFIVLLIVIVMIFFKSLIINFIFPKHEYPEMNSFYRKFPESVSHSIPELKSMRKQLFIDSKQSVGGEINYNSIFDTLNKRTNFWIEYSKYRFPEEKSLVFMDSLMLFNKNIALCAIYEISTKNSYYDVRVKDRIVINEKGLRDTIYEKDSIKRPLETDMYIRTWFKKINNKWEIYHEELSLIPKMGYMNIAHTPEQMKIKGLDYFFYRYIKVKNEYKRNPKLIGYHENAFEPINNWYYRTFDD